MLLLLLLPSTGAVHLVSLPVSASHCWLAVTRPLLSSHTAPAAAACSNSPQLPCKACAASCCSPPWQKLFWLAASSTGAGVQEAERQGSGSAAAAQGMLAHLHVNTSWQSSAWQVSPGVDMFAKHMVS